MPEKFSVIVITYNEEENIAGCMESVKWADEIIVVDSGSSDNTVAIAKRYTDKVIHNDWQGYAAQKSFALGQAVNEWVLSLDADERATEELSDEIRNAALTDADGYYIKRRNYFLDKVVSSCGWDRDYQLRLFRKSKTKLTDNLVHEGFDVKGKVSKLTGELIHYTHTDLKKTFEKINNYSTLEAEEKFKRKKVNGFWIFFYPAIAFIQHYIFRRGFTDGVHGLMVSLIHSMSKMQAYMKMWEIKNVKKSGASKQ